MNACTITRPWGGRLHSGLVGAGQPRPACWVSLPEFFSSLLPPLPLMVMEAMLPASRGDSRGDGGSTQGAPSSRAAGASSPLCFLVPGRKASVEPLGDPRPWRLMQRLCAGCRRLPRSGLVVGLEGQGLTCLGLRAATSLQRQSPAGPRWTAPRGRWETCPPAPREEGCSSPILTSAGRGAAGPRVLRHGGD